MSILTLPRRDSSRSFPVPASSRIFPLSGPLSGMRSRPYAITTLATLISRIRERLLPTFWTDTELTLYIQEGMRIWNTLTGYYRERASLSLTASQVHYQTAQEIDDVISLIRMDTEASHLDPIALRELGSFTSTYQSTAAGATPGQWIPLGLNLFILYPQASDTFSTTVDYHRLAPVPNVSGDYVQIGEDDMMALINYVVWIAKLKEGGKDIQEAMPLLEDFLKQAAKYNAKLLTSSIYRKLVGMADGGNPSPRREANEGTPFRK